jgi:hypothetical protein
VRGLKRFVRNVEPEEGMTITPVPTRPPRNNPSYKEVFQPHLLSPGSPFLFNRKGNKAWHERLVPMLMKVLCSLFPWRCGEAPEPPRTERHSTDADLGRKEAGVEALSEDRLSHMEGGLATRQK